jgi:hypothetical protein
MCGDVTVRAATWFVELRDSVLVHGLGFDNDIFEEVGRGRLAVMCPGVRRYVVFFLRVQL